MYVVMYCSLTKSGRRICIARSRKFRFMMITSVRAKRFSGCSGKTSLDLSKSFFKDRFFCIISCVKPYYFRSAFRSAFCSAFLRSGFHSCPQYGVTQEVLRRDTSVRNGSGLWWKVCEKDPVASKDAMPQMFWRRLYLPTCHHNRGSTELHGYKFAVCCF